jgi:F0F1-type ATP synthase membrane subunit b/b'
MFSPYDYCNPLIIIAIAVAGFAFGHDAAQNQVVAALQGVIGQESAQAVQAIVENASKLLGKKVCNRKERRLVEMVHRLSTEAHLL